MLRKSLSMVMSDMKRVYRKSSLYLDTENIVCNVSFSKKDNKYKTSAQCVTDDHDLKGFSGGPTAIIYVSRFFKTEIEAQAFLEKAIRNAAKRHKNSAFYREKYKNDDGLPWEFYIHGEGWNECEDPWRDYF